ncbi:MAG: hypothetical protein ACRCV9_19575 [Burkholderiaceae bacterium]
MGIYPQLSLWPTFAPFGADVDTVVPPTPAISLCGRASHDSIVARIFCDAQISASLALSALVLPKRGGFGRLDQDWV